MISFTVQAAISQYLPGPAARRVVNGRWVFSVMRTEPSGSALTPATTHEHWDRDALRTPPAC